MGSVKTLHIVGFKNSGKTTLITRWIKLFKENGLHVAVMKHHGHGATLAMPDNNKDSMQYISSGADASLVAGVGNTQYILNKQLNFSQLKYLALLDEPNVLLIEGYKEERGDKVVLTRGAEDWQHLQNLKGIILHVGAGNTKGGITQIHSRELTDQLDAWAIKWYNDVR